MLEPKLIDKYNEFYGREFDKDHSITIDKFIDFLIDMIDDGVKKNAKLNICGSDNFFFHYCEDSEEVRLDVKPLTENYMGYGVKEISIKKYEA